MGFKERDKSIDVLRAIALTGMIIIHISPTIGWIREIRNFDVPLMVFLSGVSFTLSGGGKINYSSYVFKRFQRLILPTWVFLLMFHILSIGLSVVTDQVVSINGLIGTAFSHFTFMTGWYVWIMRLFFIVALFAPFLTKITNSFKLIHLYIFIITALLLNEILVMWIGEDTSQDDWRVILEMNIPYIVMFCIGTFINRIPKTKVLTMMIISMLALTAIAIYQKNVTGAFQSLQEYKYPPQAYYMTYGIAMTLFLWLVRKEVVFLFDKIKILKMVEFIGSHTMWIYFWHIFLIVFVAEYISIASVRFIVVFIPACILTFLQSIALNRLALRIDKDSTRKLLLVLFNG